MHKYVLASALVVGFAVPASALEVTKSADISAPPAKVWSTIAEFCSIGDWHPAIAKCELSKQDGNDVRTLSLKGGGTIVEERLSRDDKAMDYTYKILKSPLPIDNYKSTIMVEPSSGGSKVTWKGNFDARARRTPRPKRSSAASTRPASRGSPTR
jgi:Polyketide cyclase / dehydrase and lipid transport.